MNALVSPHQVQNLIALSVVILIVVAVKVIGVTIWNRLPDSTEGLTQEERDDRRVARAAERVKRMK